MTEQQPFASKPTIPRLLLNIALTVIGLVICAALIWTAGGAGLGRLFANYGMGTNLADPVNTAVQLTPRDPEAFYARATVFQNNGSLPEAVQSMERAVAARPGDYFLWMELGRLRDLGNDEEGALIAFNEAVKLAPYYAQPRWLEGNVLFRLGRRDEAFAELRRAAHSDPNLLPNIIDLSWWAYGGDASAIQQAIQPQSPEWRLELARVFAKYGKTGEAIALFQSVGAIGADDRALLLNKLLGDHRYQEAYEIWAMGTDSATNKKQNGLAAITEPGFEKRIDFDAPGFGWRRMADLKGVSFALDNTVKRDGSYSLRLDFNGNAPPSTTIFYQLVLTEPGARYRLNFSARTQEIVSGGLPLIAVLDATSPDFKLISQTKPLPKGTSEWQDYSFEFVTNASTRAIKISLQREGCNSDPCPIFGHLWLDGFTLQKL